MENLKKLLKIVEETKEKREKEYISKCVQQLEKNGRLFDSLNSCDIFELGKLKGRIEEKTELATALERMIKRKEEQDNATKLETKLPKEIVCIMQDETILSLLSLIKIL